MESLDELYKIYGSYMIQLEIIQGKIQGCKRNIAGALNKPEGISDEPKNRVDEGRPGGVKGRDKVQDEGSLPAKTT